jgi:non-heme chloroperoxidase
VRTIDLAGRSGIRLAADADGPEDGPPVVLFHGGGQTRHAWGTALSAVASRGWSGLSVDLRGHGDSDWAPDGDYTLQAFAEDVVAIARARPAPPVLIGASLGGISSLIAVGELAGNELARALVLVDIAPRIEREGVDKIGEFMKAHLDGFASLEQVADAIAAFNPNRPRPTNLEGLKKNVRLGPDGRWRWHWDPRFVGGRFGSTDETRSNMTDPDKLGAAARNLTIPTLLVRGRMSDLLSEEGARELLELVPHARFADIAGAGHMVVGDRNDAFNEAVLTFLDDLPR